MQIYNFLVKYTYKWTIIKLETSKKELKLTFYKRKDVQLCNFSLYLRHKQLTKHNIVMKGINYLLAFIGGAAVGAACGVLFAPEKGSETRAKIIEALKKRGIKLSKKEMEDLASDIAEDLGIETEE